MAALYRRILAPVDFSPPSLLAVQAAMTFAAHFGAELDIIHVLVPVDTEITQARASLEALEIGDDRRVRVSRRVIRAASPVLGILEVAEEIRADLIVVGTHGASGLRHVLLGSVAEKLVNLATCPVLTVRSESPIARLSNPIGGAA